MSVTSPTYLDDDLPIVALDPKTEDTVLLQASHEFQTILEKERSPDDPTTPYEQRVAGLRNIPPFVDVSIWYIRLPDGRLGASADVGVLRTPENAHLAQFGVNVLPELRRHGLGKRLLREVVQVAERENRRLLISGSTDRVPAGAAFLERMGGKLGLESHTNQLLFSELNHDLLRQWTQQTPEGFTLGLWEGAYPEERLEEIVELNELMNEVPHGDLDVEDFHWSAEHLRQQEQSMAARGTQRWTLYVRETATGAIAGYTEVMWNPSKPEHLWQGITAVWPRYRGKGIGRWLKAAMIEKTLQDRPTVTLIRTQNADSNAPMLKINTDLGFRPYCAEAVWQIDTAAARRYLDI